MGRLSDTSPEAQRVWTSAFRAMTPARKLRLLEQQLRLARTLHEMGFRARHPGSSRQVIREAWNAIILGPDVWHQIKGALPMDQEVEPRAVLLEVIGAFQKLGIRYAIGGSWASSLYGEPRTTRDADVSVEPFLGNESVFASCFGEQYYLSVDAIKQANRDHASFNIIHIPTAFKVDVFVLKDDGFDRSLMERRSPAPGSEPSNQSLVWVSAEDIVLLKLRWFRLGNEVSERQWLDVLGVLRTQAGRLDEAYLDHWAAELGLADLLNRARVGISIP
jgi:hypothetical protein